MNVQERIRISMLIETMKSNPKASKELGLSNVSRFKNGDVEDSNRLEISKYIGGIKK